MKKLMVLAAIPMMVLSASANAAPVWNKSGYEYSKNQLSDPAALDWNIEQCSHGGIKPNVRASLAKFMNVPEADARHEYCRRILVAYAAGAIPYEDYVRFAENHGVAPSIWRALKVGGPHTLKSQSRKQSHP